MALAVMSNRRGQRLRGLPQAPAACPAGSARQGGRAGGRGQQPWLFDRKGRSARTVPAPLGRAPQMGVPPLVPKDPGRKYMKLLGGLQLPLPEAVIRADERLDRYPPGVVPGPERPRFLPALLGRDGLDRPDLAEGPVVRAATPPPRRHRSLSHPGVLGRQTVPTTSWCPGRLRSWCSSQSPSRRHN